ncbi:hypothetical protein H6503_06295 [Candidatus Woesearchaeota archaeon]|nr:hypothetical protein [Candidatus Woesearchaeota archaeon]
MKNVVYALFLSIITSLASKPVSAAPTIDNFLDVFNTAGIFLEQLLGSEYAVFAITVIIFTIMFYNIFVPLIGKIPAFKGNPTNKYGKIVSLCLAILCSLGIFGLIFLGGGAVSVSKALDSILGPYATLGGILISLLIFAMTYFGLKDASDDYRWQKALLGAALTMIFYGWIMGRKGSPLFALGWLITFIWLLVWMFRKPKDGGGSGGSGSSGKSGSSKDSDKKKGKVTLKGKVIGEDGKPKSVVVEAIDSSGDSLARARSNGRGKFTIVIKNVEEKSVTVDDVVADGDYYWNAYNGHDDHDGAEPPFKIKKDKTQEDIVVSIGDKGSGGDGRDGEDGEGEDDEEKEPFEWYPEITQGNASPVDGIVHER